MSLFAKICVDIIVGYNLCGEVVGCGNWVEKNLPDQSSKASRVLQKETVD
jgi:hypothetical protein